MQLIALIVVSVGQISSDLAANTIDNDELMSILRAESARFHDRPSLLFRFESEYNLDEGNVGPMASLGETRSGEIRWGGDRVESFLTDEIYNPNSEWANKHGYIPARKEHRVWKDGRTLGLREFVEPGFKGSSQPFTTEMKFHHRASPDLSGWFVDGVFVDSDHFSDLLLEAPDLEGIVEVSDGGQTLYRVVGSTSKGLMTVWLDAEAPHLLRRARFEASPSYVSALGDVDEVAIDVSAVGYTEVDGVLLAEEGVALYSYTLSSTGKRLKKKIATNRSEFSINPDFDNLDAFRIDFPENTIIHNWDVISLRYIWKRGELSPYVDE